jgi:hypothetical protein
MPDVLAGLGALAGTDETGKGVGIGLGSPGVGLPYDRGPAMYDVYGATGRDAAIRLGVSNHNDRFICMTGLRGC